MLQFKIGAKEYAAILEHVKNDSEWVMERRATLRTLEQLKVMPTTVRIIGSEKDTRVYAELYKFLPSKVEGRGPRIDCFMRSGYVVEQKDC